jgi:HD-GYP domain-containing protein (c-di-GMP phosphodiesterase class II)
MHWKRTSPNGDTAVMAGPYGEIALSEVIGAFSYALDLTEGEPPGHAVRTCLIGMRIAEELGLDPDSRSDLFYALLLKDAGCSANSARMAALFGADDQDVKHSSKRIDWARSFTAAVWSLRTVAPDGTLRERADRIRAIRDDGAVTRSVMQARCDRGAEIVRLIGLPVRSAEAVRALDEHWDGYGQPRGLRGTEIPLLGRILCLAQTVEIFHGARGIEAAYRVAARRSGGWFDPALVDALRAFRRDAEFWQSLQEPDLASWEPPDRVMSADDASLDRIAEAFAGIVDAKSPWTYRHSDRTCVIATSIAVALGCDVRTLTDIRRAALLHDVGKLALSNRILDKPTKLTDSEFAKIRRHPLTTMSILARVPQLRNIALMAGAHHERLDGSGYPRGLKAIQLTLPMRVLAVSDVYEAVTSQRPYRPARSSDAALQILRADVPNRLDGDVFEALAGLLADEDVLAEPVNGAARAHAVLGPHTPRPPEFRRRFRKRVFR